MGKHSKEDPAIKRSVSLPESMWQALERESDANLQAVSQVIKRLLLLSYHCEKKDAEKHHKPGARGGDCSPSRGRLAS